MCKKIKMKIMNIKANMKIIIKVSLISMMMMTTWSEKETISIINKMKLMNNRKIKIKNKLKNMMIKTMKVISMTMMKKLMTLMMFFRNWIVSKKKLKISLKIHSKKICSMAIKNSKESFLALLLIHFIWNLHASY